MKIAFDAHGIASRDPNPLILAGGPPTADREVPIADREMPTADTAERRRA